MEKSLLRDGSGLGIRSKYDSERTKYSHFQTPNSATDSDHQNAISASVLASHLASLLAIGPDIQSRCSQLIIAIRIRNPDPVYFGIDTKGPQGFGPKRGILS